MIFPDVTLKEWIKKHPALGEVDPETCDECGAEMVAYIPFVTKNWAGLRSDDCACGESPAMSVSVPTSEETIRLLSWIVEPE